MQEAMRPGIPIGDPNHRIYISPEDVDRRLSELSLRRDIIVDSVTAGLLARLECTPNHPKTAPGYHAWSETVSKLRELSFPLGWLPSDEANQGLVVNERLSLTLNVSGGDECTGVAHLNPSTRSSHGPSMASAVRANSRWLFQEMAPKQIKVGSWLLLAYWDREKEHVQLELSHPVGWREDKRPTDWSERILFPNIAHSEPVPAVGGDQKTPEIKVEIKRRA